MCHVEWDVRYEVKSSFPLAQTGILLIPSQRLKMQRVKERLMREQHLLRISRYRTVTKHFFSRRFF